MNLSLMKCRPRAGVDDYTQSMKFPAGILLLAASAVHAQDRMPPIPSDRFTPAQKDAVAAYIASPRGYTAPTGPFIPLLRSPDLMNRVQAVGEYLRFHNSIPQKLVEMGTIIVARHYSQQYEWDVHYPLAIKAGLSEETASAIAAARRPARLAADEEVFYDFVTELIRSQGVSDPLYARMKDRFGEQGVIDTTTLVGYYSTAALILNVARSPRQAGSTAPVLAPPGR
jgi:4-carboxymuconolactone decarboxylase